MAARISFAAQPRSYNHLDPEEARLFAAWLEILNRARARYAIGGAFAVHAYTGAWRDTKDLDIFIVPADLQGVLRRMNESYETEIFDPCWLAKVKAGGCFMDLLFGMANNRWAIDESWLAAAQPLQVLGVSTRVIGAEELIASKAYVARHERFDGADIAHLIHGARGALDWDRILERMGNDEELLLWHLVLFHYVYPGRSEYVPRAFRDKLIERSLQRWASNENPRLFRGSLLDPDTFAADVEEWGYTDLRSHRHIVDEEGREI